jgi:hypothetical protein
VRSIESEKGKERKLSQLLLKYGDLNLAGFYISIKDLISFA